MLAHLWDDPGGEPIFEPLALARRSVLDCCLIPSRAATAALPRMPMVVRDAASCGDIVIFEGTWLDDIITITVTMSVACVAGDTCSQWSPKCVAGV